MVKQVGVLTLQGDFHKHAFILSELGILAIKVRYPRDLERAEGLIIPGGESTTMSLLMERHGLYQPLMDYGKSFPILGTCAGLILMARSVSDKRIQPLNILDIEVERNAYGRQIHSFTDSLPVSHNGKEIHIKATFIRAPRIRSLGEQVTELASYQGEPVAVREGLHMGLTFHPELNQVKLFHSLLFENPVVGKPQTKESQSHAA